MGETWQAEVEGDAEAIFRLSGLDPDDCPTMTALCKALIGSTPQRVSMRLEAEHATVKGAHRIFINKRVSAAREKWLIGHELAEWYLRRIGYHGRDIELRANAIGSALCCARQPFKKACERYGHRVHALAKAFGVPQGVALLRVGETTGRPVVYVCRHPIARGDTWEWPKSVDGIRAAVERPPANIHPIRVSDAGRWGLMAKREAWLAAA